MYIWDLIILGITRIEGSYMQIYYILVKR